MLQYRWKEVHVMLTLIKLTPSIKAHYESFIEDWVAHEEKITPGILRNAPKMSFDEVMKHLESNESMDLEVPSLTYFAYDDDIKQIVGAVNIRLRLNAWYLREGGHIGGGVKPSMRNRGYAKKMIQLSLDILKSYEIHDVLMVCNKKNIASAQTIIKNGGILENELIINGQTEQRYWIKI